MKNESKIKFILILFIEFYSLLTGARAHENKGRKKLLKRVKK